MNKIVRTNLGIEESRLTKVDIDSEEGLSYLKKKLVEEAMEVAEAKSFAEIASELGDLLEVIETFYSLEDISEEYVKALQVVKRSEKGEFSKFESIDKLDKGGSVYGGWKEVLLVLDKE